MLELSALKEKINEILNDYDNRLNPPVKKDENVIAHYARRLFNSQKFFCGARGRVRLETFRTNLRNDKSEKPADFLLNLFDLAFSERNAAYHSWLSEKILFFISNQVNLPRMLYQSAQIGHVLEPEGIYFERVRERLAKIKATPTLEAKH